MKSYYRLMLGQKSVHASDCLAANCVGTDFGIHQDLTGQLPEEWRDFNQKFIPVYLEAWPDKSKVAAGLACGAIWTVSKGMQQGDVVLCPDGNGNYRVGEIAGPYYYAAGEMLPHRRPVTWREQTVAREEMSDALRNSTGSIGTVSNITKYATEIETLLAGTPLPPITVNDETIEDVATFAMEKHLEFFLVQNWAYTELGKQYDIYEEDGELLGQQYPSDTGPLDILAISKDRKTLLVVELKKGRASDVVVGQILRYMGYVQDALAEPDQSVRGVIIALEDDQRLKRALSMVPSIDFFRYAISFKLLKGGEE
ncbi:MAG: endonuclease NucS domain-containing protein [Rubinisphaera brasiliensis]|uniref:endonuclease NucS domain-containing protein n=1 Tax=Rubinisphaera brasiliensis TaxID=119 RepID=UPI00391A99C2